MTICLMYMITISHNTYILYDNLFCSIGYRIMCTGVYATGQWASGNVVGDLMYTSADGSTGVYDGSQQ